MCSICHLHTQFYCENGGGVYGRIRIIFNNLPIILRINGCNYHKYCLNYNFGYHFEQIIKRHICFAERCAVYQHYMVVTAFCDYHFLYLLYLNIKHLSNTLKVIAYCFIYLSIIFVLIDAFYKKYCKSSPCPLILNFQSCV